MSQGLHAIDRVELLRALLVQAVAAGDASQMLALARDAQTQALQLGMHVVSLPIAGAVGVLASGPERIEYARSRLAYALEKLGGRRG